ncbi:MAG: ribbon-helix-helix domain-containing protein [Nanoarchaeota archaeon]
MDTIQIRMSPKLLKIIDAMVRTGIYSNRADVIRDAVRRFVWEKEVGSVKNKGNSVEILSNVRAKLSKERFDLDEINRL